MIKIIGVIALVFICLFFLINFNQSKNNSQNYTSDSIAEYNISDKQKFTLTASEISKNINGDSVRMYAYNNSVPGPTLRVKQNSEIELELINNLSEPTLLHSHGVRMDNEFDGTHLVQHPVDSGEKFTYKLKFPDPGVYWYHPHIREDRQQEMGLYGLFIVEPENSDYWPKVDREFPLILDDVLLTSDGINFGDEVDRVLMGRYGNKYLINGDISPTYELKTGEIVRFYVLNAANVRPFRLSIPNAKIRLVGGDSGAFESETIIDELVIAPSERYVIDVLFEDAGSYSILNRGNEDPVEIASINILKGRGNVSDLLIRKNKRVGDEMKELVSNPSYIQKNLDLYVSLQMMMNGSSMGSMQGMPCHMMPDGSMMGDCDGESDGIEWEDSMQMMNKMTNKNNVNWEIIDTGTSLVNEKIDWKFKVGDKVRVKIFNDPNSDHPMQHPIHFHGQRFVVLSTDGVPNINLVWKDTVLVPSGKTVEILLDITNPGDWMAHCHIAEHLEGGMMFEYSVAKS